MSSDDYNKKPRVFRKRTFTLLRGAFVWPLAAGASILLLLPIYRNLSESGSLETPVEAISRADFPLSPDPAIKEVSDSKNGVPEQIPEIEPLVHEQLGVENGWKDSLSGLKQNRVNASVSGAEERKRESLDQSLESNWSAAESKWNRIQPEEIAERAITIMMPGQATFQESYFRTPVGKVTHQTYTAKPKGATFTASYSAIPKIAVSLVGERAIFTKVRDTVLERANGEERSFEPTHCMGIEGMKLAYISRPSGEMPPFNGVAHMFMIDRTLVVFNAVLSNLIPAHQADRYFGSISIIHPLVTAYQLDQIAGCDAAG